MKCDTLITFFYNIIVEEKPEEQMLKLSIFAVRLQGFCTPLPPVISLSYSTIANVWVA